MGKTYTLDDNGECLAELKAMHEEKLLMRRRLECDEITPDEWRRWHAGYRTRLDEIREAISRMRDELLSGMLIWNVRNARGQQS